MNEKLPMISISTRESFESYRVGSKPKTDLTNNPSIHRLSFPYPVSNVRSLSKHKVVENVCCKQKSVQTIKLWDAYRLYWLEPMVSLAFVCSRYCCLSVPSKHSPSFCSNMQYNSLARCWKQE